MRSPEGQQSVNLCCFLEIVKVSRSNRSTSSDGDGDGRPTGVLPMSGCMPPSFNAKMRFCPCAVFPSPSAEDRDAIPQFSPEFTPLPFPHRTARIAWILCDIPEVRNHAITLY